MDAPTAVDKHLFTKAISVARGTRAVICDPVAFDAQQIPPGFPRVPYPEINEEARDADLVLNLVSQNRQRSGDILLDKSESAARWPTSERSSLPVSAYCKNVFSTRTPTLCVRPRSMSPAEMDENTSQRRRARLISTLRRLSPPWQRGSDPMAE